MVSKSEVKELKPEAEAPVQTDECRHHWIIESPHGAFSGGRCKLCGGEREFRNSANDYIWDDDSSSSGARYGVRGARPSPKVAIQDDDGVAASGSGSGEAVLVV